VALVSSLAKVLNESMVSLGLRCGAVAGTGYQSESERQSQLGLFRSGDVRILAATAALEEGIDVSDCAFVVRYSSVPTTKAHIQGAGRARHPNAVIYYFENNPRLERQKEAKMTSVARDMSLSLGSGELQDAVRTILISPGQRHPYPCGRSGRAFEDGSGEVNVFNAKQIFIQYCSITLGSTVQPKSDLYQYNNKPGEQNLLARIRFPTPGGWRSISQVDYKSFWELTDIDQVVSESRSKRKSQAEKEEMCFVYIVVILLREAGFLDNHNRPAPAIRFDVNRNCDLAAAWSNAIAIKNSVFQSCR
jgi:endoribonuclease Dicer